MKKKKLKVKFLGIFWLFGQKLELPESRCKFRADRNGLQKFKTIFAKLLSTHEG